MVWDNVDQIKYHNNLINQRLTWLGTFEGLLFVANTYSPHPYLLPCLGIMFAFSVGLGTHAANCSLNALNAQAYTNWYNYLMPGSAVPVMIAVVWIAILSPNIFSQAHKIIHERRRAETQ